MSTGEGRMFSQLFSMVVCICVGLGLLKVVN